MNQPLSQLVARIQQPDCAADLAASPPNDAGMQAIIVADFRTARPIPVLAARQYFNQNGLQSRITRTVQSTLFAAICTSQGLNVTLTQDAVNDAVAYIAQTADANLNTLDPTIAAQTWNLTQLMQAVYQQDAASPTPQNLGLSPTHVAALFALGGGVVWGPNSCAVSDVTAARQWLSYTEAIDAKRQAIAAGYNATVSQLDAADPRVTPSVNPATATVPTGAQLAATFSQQVGQ